MAIMTILLEEQLIESGAVVRKLVCMLLEKKEYVRLEDVETVKQMCAGAYGS